MGGRTAALSPGSSAAGSPESGSKLDAANTGKSSGLLMDNDFAVDFPAGLAISARARRRLLRQLESDARLLTAHNLMDYSVLVGVSRVTPDGPQRPARDLLGDPLWVLSSTDGEYVYALGIIDLFQRYNVSKKVERSLKKLRHASRTVDISALPPEGYAARLLRFVADSVFP